MKYFETTLIENLGHGDCFKFRTEDYSIRYFWINFNEWKGFIRVLETVIEFVHYSPVYYHSPVYLFAELKGGFRKSELGFLRVLTNLELGRLI